MSNQEKIHIGVYGIYSKDNAILMIKKNRGPYTGNLDLPGGSIEFGESFEKALKREFLEETNAVITKMDFLANENHFCQYKKEGALRNFHHIGIYYTVDLEISHLKHNPDGQDSDGAIFIQIESIKKDNTSPISYRAIQKFLEK